VVELVEGQARAAGAAATFLDHRLQPVASGAHEAELGRDEEPVQGDQQQDGKDE